jgi:hypothetical protein
MERYGAVPFEQTAKRPRGAWPATPEAADERSVDVDERRDQQAGDGSSPRPVAAAVQLPPAQQAWARYATHTLRCLVCRDVDRICDESGRLYRAWRDLADDAFRQLGGGTVGGTA